MPLSFRLPKLALSASFFTVPVLMFGVWAGFPQPARAKDAAPPRPSLLTLTVSTNDPLNLFYLDSLSPSQPITLAIEAKNGTNKAGGVTYQWKLTDYWGKLIRVDVNKGASLAPGASEKWYLSIHKDADLKGRTGIYAFTLTASKGGEKAEARAAFGVLPHPAPGLRERSLFGVATDHVGDQTLPALQRIGARWLRTNDGINWAASEPAQKGEYNWDRFDRLSTEARASNVSLLPVLDGTPGWAHPKGPDGKPNLEVGAPEKLDDHADFVQAAVARYTKEIKYWELWNEPNVMGPNWGDTAQRFRDLVKADYPAAKKANPGAVVLAAGGASGFLQNVVFPPSGESRDSIAELKDFVDETSTHPHASGAPEGEFFSQAEQAVAVSKRNGKDRVWITGEGWNEEATQLARYVPRAYALSALAGVSQLDWTTLDNDQNGLFGSDFSPHAAAVSYAVAAHYLDNTLFVRDLWPHSSRIFGGVFKNPDGLKVAVAWAVGDSGTLSLDNAKEIIAYDLMGGEIGKRDGNRLDVPFGEDAVYLTSNGDQAAFLTAVQNAKIIGITPVEIVVKPFLSPISQTPPLRVQVTNVLNRPIDGDILAGAPKGWKLAQDRMSFGPLEPGQSTVVELPVRQAVISPANAYPVSVTAVSRHRGMQSLLVKISGPDWRIRREQTLSLAVAKPGTPVIDGDLGEWSDALPLQMNAKEFLSPWASAEWRKAWTPGNLSATIYTKYDADNFYIAAKVADNVHSSDSAAENLYHFPYNGDSLQLAFGSAKSPVDAAKRLTPSDTENNRGLPLDTDYEFALTLTPKGPEVFRLRMPDSGPVTPYPTNPPNGLGLTDSVKFAAKRDDVNEITTYEAAIPWSELKNLSHDQPFHFAVKLNDRDRETGLEGWMESSAGAGELRGSPLSFSPSWQSTTANLSDWTLLKE